MTTASKFLLPMTNNLSYFRRIAYPIGYMQIIDTVGQAGYVE